MSAATQVLVVDDSEPDRVYTQIMLERSGHRFAVTATESGREALDLLRGPGGPDFELILLDINMPGMDGFEFLRAYEALQAPRTPPAGVVFLTSSPDPADRARALAHRSVRGFVTKPIDRSGVAELLRCLPP